jgi:hypothetical protein
MPLIRVEIHAAEGRARYLASKISNGTGLLNKQSCISPQLSNRSTGAIAPQFRRPPQKTGPASELAKVDLMVQHPLVYFDGTLWYVTQVGMSRGNGGARLSPMLGPRLPRFIEDARFIENARHVFAPEDRREAIVRCLSPGSGYSRCSNVARGGRSL